MIIVKSMDDFSDLINIAKSKNLDYVVWGSEKPAPPNVSFANEGLTHFRAKYILSCSTFTAYVSLKVKAEESETITSISKDFDFVPINEISHKDGTFTFS